jgi:hypothetical protein
MEMCSEKLGALRFSKRRAPAHLENSFRDTGYPRVTTSVVGIFPVAHSDDGP